MMYDALEKMRFLYELEARVRGNDDGVAETLTLQKIRLLFYGYSIPGTTEQKIFLLSW
jgi:hypothetical protein